MSTFLNHQNKKQQNYYVDMLTVVGSLSNLFSTSSEPYIDYRVAENIFCKAFEADNHSRSDHSADASKNDLGLGIKTFLEKNGKTLQKVAEFNAGHSSFSSLSVEDKIKKISDMRNARIEATKKILGLKDIIYHCITRKPGEIIVYETPFLPINIQRIKGIKDQGNIIKFSDNSEEYSFNITKSVLSKRFVTNEILLSLPVKILDDPLDTLEKLFSKSATELEFSDVESNEYIYLPLYSVIKDSKVVPEKSGLNQWNASGRPRDPNEIYIPIPSVINKNFSDFFPPRDKSFKMHLPNKKVLNVKVCQDNSKALMSNPNSALGQWLLRDVLSLEERELLTYDMLEKIGLDSVLINRIDEENYTINFTRINSYEAFLDQNL